MDGVLDGPVTDVDDLNLSGALVVDDADVHSLAIRRPAHFAGEPGQSSAEFRSLFDYQAYSRVADNARESLRRELTQLDLEKQRRVAFYPLGAAIALLLEQTRPARKRAYAERPFELASLLKPTARGPPRR
jgi:hypothetical protein